MLRALIPYFLTIVIAEVVVLLNPSLGLVLHSAILLSVLALSSFGSWHGDPASNLLLSLSLPPLIRIISITLPLVNFPRTTWFLVAGIPVLVASMAMMKVRGAGLEDVGITFKRPLVQACITLTGVPFGVMEYSILRPEPLVANPSIVEFVMLGAMLFIFTGFVEEFAFRGLIQGSAVEALGDGAGMVFVAAIYAALHVGWLSALDIVFVFSIGLFFGYVALKTGSIAGVTISHGMTNVFLFLVMPSVI